MKRCSGHCSRNICSAECTSTTKIMKTLFFKESTSHNISNMFYLNSKFALPKKGLIFNNLKINEIDVLCLRLITRYTTQNF